MVIGSYTGMDVFEGTEIRLERWEGKGNTQLVVSGPRAAEIVDYVHDFVVRKVDGRHVRSVWKYDTLQGRAVVVHGRLRQTMRTIELALIGCEMRIACSMPGTPVPQISALARRQTPSASSSA